MRLLKVLMTRPSSLVRSHGTKRRVLATLEMYFSGAVEKYGHLVEWDSSGHLPSMYE